MEGLEFLVGREHVDPKLLMSADPSLARVMGQMNLCTSFSGMLGGKNVVACLLNEALGNGICDVSNIAVAEEHSDSDFTSQLLFYVMNYAREKGFRFLEVGVGNADLDAHKALQKMGYRVIGVIPDYYQSDVRGLTVLNGIVNRDMIRYRVDFLDGWVTWTKEVKQRYDQ